MCLWKRWKKIQFLIFFFSSSMGWIDMYCELMFVLEEMNLRFTPIVNPKHRWNFPLFQYDDTQYYIFFTSWHSTKIKMVVKTTSVSRGSTIDCGCGDKIKWSISKCKRDWICYESFTTAKQLWIQNHYQVSKVKEIKPF